MKTTRVIVRFQQGLHARTAARLVQLLKQFQSRVILRTGTRVAASSSILSVLLLAATFNTQLEVQASGVDEAAAIRATEIFFQSNQEPGMQQVQPALDPRPATRA